jgi:hypothetical protein
MTWLTISISLSSFSFPSFYAVLEVNAFERLLGPCKNIMKRNAQAYDSQMAAVMGDSSPQDLR